MIDKQITDFNESLLALRDFVTLIDPFLSEKVDEHNKHVSPLIASALVDELITNGNLTEGEELDKFIAAQSRINEDIQTLYSDIPSATVQKIDEDGDGKRSLTIQIKSKDQVIGKHIDNLKKTRKHIDLLYTNALISTLSSVEWFFSQLLHLFYDKYPDSAGIDKRSISLIELKSFETIRDAEKHLIDLKIEEIIRGNFESWIALLKSDLKLGLGYLNDINDELVEIYQRRNLLVHNGGIINSIYYSKVNPKNRTGLQIGQKLKINKEYLDNSINKLQKSFILIGAELWKKVESDNTNRSEILTDIVYENLLYSRWDLAEGLCYFILKDPVTSPVDKAIAQLNYWLCQKEKGNYKTIESELKKADYSDKKEIFQLGLYALRNEIEEFFKILPIALDSKQINIERLEEFPIMRKVRETIQYQEFKENSKYFKQEDSVVIRPNSVEK